jgi:predicted permease
MGDVRQALRGVRLRAGFSATVIATVAIAVGATTSVFSVVNGVLLRPLDYPEPERLVLAWQTKPDWADHPSSQLRAFASRFPLSVPTYFDWEDGRTGFDAFGLRADRRWVMQGADGADMVRGGMLTSGVFRALRVDPLMGRYLVPEDDQAGSPAVSVLSHASWRDRFGSDPDILGRSLSLDGVPHTVVGVMPPGFSVPQADGEMWTSLQDDERDDRGSAGYAVLGRLADGATVESLRADLDVIQARLGEAYPDQQADMRSHTQGLLDAMVGDVRATLFFLLAAVGLVLAIACVNIANMLSVGGLARRREMAVRAALGASRGRLVRSLLTESAVLAALGGLGGILLAAMTLPALLRVLPTALPRADTIGVDGTVLVFGLFVTAATSMLVGVLPALQAARTQPKQMMDANSRGLAGGRSGARIRTGLVVTEVALAFVLLCGASLLATSFNKLSNVERGFQSEGLVALYAAPSPVDYPEAEDRRRFRSELRDRLGAIPGVQVSRTNQIPLSGSSSSTTYYMDRDGEEQEVTVMISIVDEHYFDVLEIGIAQGRGFDGSEVAEGPLVGVVNQAFADEFFPGESALGKRIRAQSTDEVRAMRGGSEVGPAPETTIIGVARDVRHQGLHVPAEPKLYVPAVQNHRDADDWLLRVQGDPGSVMELARQAVIAVSPSTPVRGVEVLEERIASSVAVPRFRTFFVVGLALMATVLALLGVYGVVTFAVSQRTRELAVRMAIGAHPRDVIAGTLSSGLKLALAGIVLGGVMAIGANGLLEQFLYDVDPTQPGTYLVVALVVGVVTAGASWLPARRAARVDPVSVLNAE